MVLVVKNLPANAGDIRDVDWIPGQEDLLEEGRATHASILSTDSGAWWATVRGVAKSRTRQKRLHMHARFRPWAPLRTHGAQPCSAKVAGRGGARQSPVVFIYQKD